MKISAISLKFVPPSPVDIESALVEAMAWCWFGDKPLVQPLIMKFYESLWHHLARKSSQALTQWSPFILLYEWAKA